MANIKNSKLEPKTLLFDFFKVKFRSVIKRIQQSWQYKLIQVLVQWKIPHKDNQKEEAPIPISERVMGNSNKVRLLQ